MSLDMIDRVMERIYHHSRVLAPLLRLSSIVTNDVKENSSSTTPRVNLWPMGFHAAALHLAPLPLLQCS